MPPPLHPQPSLLSAPPEEALEAALAAVRPDWRAYRSLAPEQSRAEAQAAGARYAAGERGPLLGVPYSLKDLYGATGWPTYAGSGRRLGGRFEQDGPLVKRLRALGAVLVGKTQTVEFAFGGLGSGRPERTPVNPWGDGLRAPGGSSAGAGVSLLEGSAKFAIGTDTLGSVRIPASFTGRVGLKTTHGRWPTGGIVPLSPRLDTAGLLANSAAEAALVFSALDPNPGRIDPQEDLRKLSFVVPELLLDACEGEVLEVFFAGVEALRQAGARQEDGPLPPLPEALDLFEQGVVSAVELLDLLRRELPAWEAELNPSVAVRMQGAAALPALEYLRRVAALNRLAAESQAILRDHWLVTPTVAIAPPPLSELADPARYAPKNRLALRNTGCVSIIGACAISIPIGLDASGLPVGLQLVAPGGAEEQLLSVAQTIERRLGSPQERLGRPPR